MKLYTIDIRSWTASFRFPNIISGVQLTLEVPPLSTVLGIINASAGKYLKHNELNIGYYFDFQGKEFDLETIYMMDSSNGKANNKAKSNVIKREFLFDNFLRIYTDNEEVANYLKKPYYPLTLGRMNDLATVNSAGIIEREFLKTQNPEHIRGQIIPFFNNNLPGVIQALPKYFTDSIPRQNIGTEPYSVINYKAKVRSNLTAYRDEINGKPIDIFLHKINFI